ncbi:Alpha/Beta hydrolase protein [Boletus reticuloceps]|uniref:Alpha/Beta hydrolase protein n=1 Tax=Boletus reticuloceps TaxID=495285 RepID=A0A8I2YRX0_9AGAM|nr:Alpha/Beta hydrolase protein [Boletus reticuloceps]
MDNSTKERKLALQGGRTLAYVTAGNPSSTTVLLCLHGTFAVGEASSVSRTLVSKDTHRIYPTLPGWGNTSPPLPSTSYVDCLMSDMTVLLDHLYPDRGRDIKLYVAGGSFGTVPAQILYGASYDKFPYGRCIVGVLLMTAFAPFRYYEDYAKYMTWSNYLLIGPMSQWPLVRPMFAHLATNVARKVSTVDNAEKFLQEFIFDKMDKAEREEYAQWRAREGIAVGEIETRFAKNIVRSVATSWEGFKLTSSVLHADWGFRPDGLDEEHSRPSVMFVTNPGDKEAPQAWTEYLAACYKNVKVKTVGGSHIGTLLYMDEIWGEFLAEVK